MKMIALTASAAMLVTAPAFAQIKPMAPAEYVATAGASDLYERTSSQIVLASTRNPKVRAFATMMIQDHGKSTAAVKAAAMKSRVKPTPPKLNPLQTELVAELNAETGQARDAAYIAQQRAAHGQALNVQKAYAADGTAAPLKAAAAGIVPVVEHHIEMLKAM
jgi:putative membrane protein